MAYNKPRYKSRFFGPFETMFNIEYTKRKKKKVFFMYFTSFFNNVNGSVSNVMVFKVGMRCAEVLDK